MTMLEACYSRTFNTLDWLSFLINEKVVVDRS